MHVPVLCSRGTVALETESAGHASDPELRERTPKARAWSPVLLLRLAGNSATRGGLTLLLRARCRRIHRHADLHLAARRPSHSPIPARPHRGADLVTHACKPPKIAARRKAKAAGPFPLPPAAGSSTRSFPQSTAALVRRSRDPPVRRWTSSLSCAGGSSSSSALEIGSS
ncbi:uncharacterized protein LOC133889420 [Phragmites australis]|uniref:uncharacterized protein LOC133889420 n=1 Tax=Phragmites australis TaxID=29695 RepID=UPI002D765BCB|nr:uncharacterized protein LOC133889420 [Phragmites australis]